MRKWYFALIGDTEYKKDFSICYVKAYPYLIDLYIGSLPLPSCFYPSFSLHLPYTFINIQSSHL